MKFNILGTQADCSTAKYVLTVVYFNESKIAQIGIYKMVSAEPTIRSDKCAAVLVKIAEAFIVQIVLQDI